MANTSDPAYMVLHTLVGASVGPERQPGMQGVVLSRDDLGLDKDAAVAERQVKRLLRLGAIREATADEVNAERDRRAVADQLEAEGLSPDDAAAASLATGADVPSA